MAFAQNHPNGIKIEIRQGGKVVETLPKWKIITPKIVPTKKVPVKEVKAPKSKLISSTKATSTKKLSDKDTMIVYVDALNLYYGLLRGTKYRWLDIYKFVQTQFSQEIREIKFFFAAMKPTLLDMDAPSRQKAYLDALKEFVWQKCTVTFIEWYFLDNVSKSGIDTKSGELVTIITNEEKGTDVNIWVHIVNDSSKRNDYDTVCLISNDSDLGEALRIWKENGKKILLLSPIKRLSPKQRQSKKKKHIRISYPAWSLKQYADACNYDVTAKALSLCQMPAQIKVGSTVIDRPESRA